MFALVTILVAVFGSIMARRMDVYPKPRYAVRILSYDPLLIYLEGFISPSERKHLMRLGYAWILVSLSSLMLTRS